MSSGQPYLPLCGDYRDIHQESARLIELGRLLIRRRKVLVPEPYQPVGPDDPAVLETSIAQLETRIAEDFSTKRDRAKSRVISRLCVYHNESSRIEPRLLRIISYMLADLVTENNGGISVYEIGKATAVNPLDPAELLEIRRMVAAMAVEGVLDVQEMEQNRAYVYFSRKTLSILLGGTGCIADTSVQSIAALRQWREQRPLQASPTSVSAKPSPQPKTASTDMSALVTHLRQLPVLTPAEIDALVVAQGYIGQSQARKAICLAAYRHVQRLRKIYLDNVDPRELPRRENILCIGKTGVGKTFLFTILFEKVFKLPSVIVDTTRYTESGYVGEKVEWVLSRLLFSAKGNVPLAQVGLVCWDEIDKIASSGGNRASFGGQGTTKDVSGLGVQRGLLKILEGSTLDIPIEVGGDSGRGQRVQFSTGNVQFVACGAFSGLQLVSQTKPPMGFGRDICAHESKAAGAPSSADLARFGLLDELVGRFGLTVAFDNLSAEDMKAILERNTLSQYRMELALSGIELVIDPSVIDLLVRRALDSRTGARALSATLSSVLTEACYEAYSTQGVRRICLSAHDDDVTWETA